MNKQIIQADGGIDDFLQEIGPGGSVQLSYPHVILWWLNGNPQLEPRNGARYYGGWAVDAEQLLEFANKTEANIPASFERAKHWIGGGKTLDLYVSRMVTVAPIGERQSYLLQDERAFKWLKGARRHVQMLAYLAEDQQDKFSPVGPVVLSVKGINASKLLNVFQAWDKHTAQVRREIAPGIRTNYFWREVGTTGEAIEIEMVGQTGAQSAITPIKVELPKDIEPYVYRRWVGNEMSQTMNELYLKSKAWFDDWSPAAVEEPVPFAA